MGDTTKIDTIENAELHSHILWILKRIQTDFYFSLDGKGRMFVSPKEPFKVHAGETDAPPYGIQNGILAKLQDWGALELQEVDDEVLADLGMRVDEGEYFQIRPLQPKFGELLEEYRLSEKIDSSNNISIARFDEQEHILFLDDHAIDISLGNEAVLCRIVFSQAIGTKIAEDLIEQSLEEAARYQADSKDIHAVAYNAMAAINRKIKEATGITRLLKFKKGHMWAEIE